MTCTNFGFSKNIQELKKSILGRLVWLHVCLTAIFMVYLYTFIRKLFPQPVGAQFFDRTQRKLQIQDSAMECLIWLWARCQGYHWMYVRSGLSNLVCGICKQVSPPPQLGFSTLRIRLTAFRYAKAIVSVVFLVDFRRQSSPLFMPCSACGPLFDFNTKLFAIKVRA